MECANLIKTKTEDLPASAGTRKSFIILRRAFSVLWFCFKTHVSKSSFLFFKKKKQSAVQQQAFLKPMRESEVWKWIRNYPRNQGTDRVFQKVPYDCFFTTNKDRTSQKQRNNYRQNVQTVSQAGYPGHMKRASFFLIISAKVSIDTGLKDSK